MNKIYISIPLDIDGKTISNYWIKHFTNKGFNVISSYRLENSLKDKNLSKGIKTPNYGEIENYCMMYLKQCTHIFLCRGWINSTKCLNELTTAVNHNLGIITEQYESKFVNYIWN